jgi:hypothetical protein
LGDDGVTESTSPGEPSTDPVTVIWTRGSRTASRAQAASVSGDVGSTAEPTAKSSMPAAATGRAVGWATARGAEAVSDLDRAVSAGTVAGEPKPSRNPAASARGASGRSLAVCVACRSTKKPTSSKARSASVISQSGRPGCGSG